MLDLLLKGQRNTGETSIKERQNPICTPTGRKPIGGGPFPSPLFNFRVVKNFKSTLSRQVAEAVRIQLRGSVLNVKGLYNRSKLTRLVVDEEWDKKVWAEAWVENREIDEIVTEDLKGPIKYKKKRG